MTMETTPTPELTASAKYGQMAFDIFLAERWDPEADATQDEKQWNSLARQYLSMSLGERHPYRMESGRRRLNNHYSTAATGTEAIILTRILPRFQTIQERNFCALKYTNESHNPALLRTYYSDINGENKDEAHKIMVRDAILETCVHKDGNWNDKALYDFGDDWQRILLRMPELCDQEVGYGESENKEEDQEDLEAPPPDDREALESWLWSRNVAIRFYVRDREAMEKDLIKVFYLDTHGEAIWSHKFNAKSILQFNGAWYSMSLAEINGCFSGSRENGCELFL